MSARDYQLSALMSLFVNSVRYPYNVLDTIVSHVTLSSTLLLTYLLTYLLTSTLWSGPAPFIDVVHVSLSRDIVACVQMTRLVLH